MNMKQSKLKVDSILEYYDNPQLLTARDCFDTLYLCLLYEDTPECKYTAIRISSKRLQDFCMGKKDLRSLFLSPEGDKEYFNVRGADNNLVLDLKINTTIPEDRLPMKVIISKLQVRKALLLISQLKIKVCLLK